MYQINPRSDIYMYMPECKCIVHRETTVLCLRIFSAVNFIKQHVFQKIPLQWSSYRQLKSTDIVGSNAEIFLEGSSDIFSLPLHFWMDNIFVDHDTTQDPRILNRATRNFLNLGVAFDINLTPTIFFQCDGRCGFECNFTGYVGPLIVKHATLLQIKRNR